MNLDKFEEATEVVKKVTLRTKLIYSEYFSEISKQSIFKVGKYAIYGSI